MFKESGYIYKVSIKHPVANVQFSLFFDAVPTCIELAMVLWDRGAEWFGLAALVEERGGAGLDADVYSQKGRAFNELAKAIDQLDISLHFCCSELISGIVDASLSIESHLLCKRSP